MGGGIAGDMEDVCVAKSMQIRGRREGIGILRLQLKYFVKMAKWAFGVFVGKDNRALESEGKPVTCRRFCRCLGWWSG